MENYHEENKNTIGTPIELNEAERIYYYPGGPLVRLVNVIELVARPSGAHRIKTADGRLHIIPDGWIHIEIDPGEKKD